MRVMVVPKSTQIVDSVEFAENLHELRLRLHRDSDKHVGLYIPISPYLLAYMAWPNDDSERDQWIAAIRAAGLLAHADAAGASDEIGHVRLKLIAAPALEAKAKKLEALQGAWSAVADIFQRLVDMATDVSLVLRKGPSISKAIDLCQADKSYGRAQLERFWSQYRDVAHLITAAAFLASREKSGTGSIITAAWISPDAVIGVADGFEFFGLNTKPHGAADTFLPSGDNSAPSQRLLQTKSLFSSSNSFGGAKAISSTPKSRKEYISKHTE